MLLFNIMSSIGFLVIFVNCISSALNLDIWKYLENKRTGKINLFLGIGLLVCAICPIIKLFIS